MMARGLNIVVEGSCAIAAEWPNKIRTKKMRVKEEENFTEALYGKSSDLACPVSTPMALFLPHEIPRPSVPRASLVIPCISTDSCVWQSARREFSGDGFLYGSGRTRPY